MKRSPKHDLGKKWYNNSRPHKLLKLNDSQINTYGNYIDQEFENKSISDAINIYTNEKNFNIKTVKEKFYEFIERINKIPDIDIDYNEINQNLTVKIDKILDVHSSCIIFEKLCSRVLVNQKIKKNWSEEETRFFLGIIFQYCYIQKRSFMSLDNQDWNFISSIIPGKNIDQCKSKWQSLLKINLAKVPWTQNEDALLYQIIKVKGTKQWKDIAKELNQRTGYKHYRHGKQCRERWINHLDPKVNRGLWSTEDDLALLKSYLEVGKKWAEISKNLCSRTENAVKNRWNSLIKRQKFDAQIDKNAQDVKENDQLSTDSMTDETERKLCKLLIKAKEEELLIKNKKLPSNNEDHIFIASAVSDLSKISQDSVDDFNLKDEKQEEEEQEVNKPILNSKNNNKKPGISTKTILKDLINKEAETLVFNNITPMKLTNIDSNNPIMTSNPLNLLNMNNNSNNSNTSPDEMNFSSLSNSSIMNSSNNTINSNNGYYINNTINSNNMYNMTSYPFQHKSMNNMIQQHAQDPINTNIKNFITQQNVILNNYNNSFPKFMVANSQNPYANNTNTNSIDISDIINLKLQYANANYNQNFKGSHLFNKTLNNTTIDILNNFNENIQNIRDLKCEDNIDSNDSKGEEIKPKREENIQMMKSNISLNEDNNNTEFGYIQLKHIPDNDLIFSENTLNNNKLYCAVVDVSAKSISFVAPITQNTISRLLPKNVFTTPMNYSQAGMNTTLQNSFLTNSNLGNPFNSQPNLTQQIFLPKIDNIIPKGLIGQNPINNINRMNSIINFPNLSNISDILKRNNSVSNYDWSKEIDPSHLLNSTFMNKSNDYEQTFPINSFLFQDQILQKVKEKELSKQRKSINPDNQKLK